MAFVDEVIEGKARKAMQVLSRNVKVTAAYLFGSQIMGKPDPFFPASVLHEKYRDSAGFAAWILSHGVEVRPYQERHFEK